MDAIMESGRDSKPTLDLIQPDDDDERRYWIEVQDDDSGHVVPLEGKKLLIGTGRKANLRLDDPTVSAEHCVLTIPLGGGGVVVRDLQSRNGTYVGGASVTEATCRGGTSIGIGRSTIVLHESVVENDAADLVNVAPLDGVAGASLAMRRVAREVRRLAEHGEPVLVTGETGTGKELIARALHEEGVRRERPFVAVNVAALPRELVESELFGHERGAFTGAVGRRAGAFAEAEGGTLFLDEIGELPLEAQPKLLRALDGYEVRSVGGTGNGRRYRVRLIAATHVAIGERVCDGSFRRDLFHRLEVFVIEIPPLRQRKGDIGAIAARLLRRERGSAARRTLTPSALARLTAHDWPGNVRELRNVLLRAVHAAGAASTLTAQHVDVGLRPRAASRPPITPGLAKALLHEHDGNLSAAARAAGIPRTTFLRKLAL
jgi:DNA-binding NtrC family response regulator